MAAEEFFQWTTDFMTYDDISYADIDQKRLNEYQKSELGWMLRIAKEHGQKVGLTWNIGWGNDPGSDAYGPPMTFRFLEEITKAGGRAKGQIFGRTQGYLFAFVARLHPFVASPTFQKLQEASKREGANLLVKLKDPGTREQIMAETRAMFSKNGMAKNPGLRELAALVCDWDVIYPWISSYEPAPETSIKSTCARDGRRPLDVAFDHLVAGGILWKPLNTYSTRDHSPFLKVYNHPQVCLGGDDAGAHHTMFMDATNPSHMLSHWVRDRSRGPKLSIARAVQLQTQQVAEIFGLPDRGIIAVGKRADINVIDLENVTMNMPYFVEDLPMGAGRWLQRVDGYRLTLVLGQPTFDGGNATGILPGRLLRNPQRSADAWQGISVALSGSFEASQEGANPTMVDNRERALRGAGSGGASMGARVMRDSVEVGKVASDSAAPPRSRL